jgi:hypothetical protein
MAKKRELVKKAAKKKTSLIRIFEEDFSSIHSIAGELQAANGKGTSIAEAFQFVLKNFKRPRKSSVSNSGRVKILDFGIKEFKNDPLRLFSLKHQKYLE